MLRSAFVVVFATCIALLVVLAGYTPKREEMRAWGIGFLVWALVSLFLFFWWFERRQRKHAEPGFDELRGAVRFFQAHSPYPLAIGGILGMLAAGAVLCVPVSPGEPPSQRILSSISAFLATSIGFVGVDAFYRRHAPITEMSVLLSSLAGDIRQATSEGQRVWLVYPALNLGFYRAYRSHAGLIPDGHPYRQYREAFCDAAFRLGAQLRVMTYPTHLYDRLFECYHDQVLNGRPATGYMSGLDETAAKEANYFVSQVYAGGLSTFSPAGFPDSVALVGNVVYMIHTYGMPQYDPALEEDPFPASGANGIFIPVEDNLVDLVVYRRVDSLLAQSIEKHLERLAIAAGSHRPRTTT